MCFSFPSIFSSLFLLMRNSMCVINTRPPLKDGWLQISCPHLHNVFYTIHMYKCKGRNVLYERCNLSWGHIRGFASYLHVSTSFTYAHIHTSICSLIENQIWSKICLLVYIVCDWAHDYLRVSRGGKEKKFHVYPQIPMLWSNIRLLI